MPEYIIVEVGQLADGKGNPSFQIARLVKDWTIAYYSASAVMTINNPVSLAQARVRLEKLEEVKNGDQ